MSDDNELHQNIRLMVVEAGLTQEPYPIWQIADAIAMKFYEPRKVRAACLQLGIIVDIAKSSFRVTCAKGRRGTTIYGDELVVTPLHASKASKATQKIAALLAWAMEHPLENPK